MTKVLVLVFTVLFSYLFGSMNSAIVVCRIMKGKDIREYGSNNAGLTNVLRVFGKPTAAVTLIVDLIKGVVAVLLCKYVALHFDVEILSNPLFICYLAGIVVILGHVFPLYYGFRGGKGVLLTATTLLAIDPFTCALALSVFVIVVSLSKYVSLASILAGIAYPIITFITQTMRDYDKVWMNVVFTSLIALLIVVKHRSNIKRLLSGTENKLSFKSKSKE